jgi:hypothetical protein
MPFGFRRRNRICEHDVAPESVVVHKSARNGVDNAKGFRVGRTAGFEIAAQNFDSRRSGKFVAGNGNRRKRENKLRAVTGLVGSQI